MLLKQHLLESRPLSLTQGAFSASRGQAYWEKRHLLPLLKDTRISIWYKTEWLMTSRCEARALGFELFD